MPASFYRVCCCFSRYNGSPYLHIDPDQVEADGQESDKLTTGGTTEKYDSIELSQRRGDQGTLREGVPGVEGVPGGEGVPEEEGVPGEEIFPDGNLKGAVSEWALQKEEDEVSTVSRFTTRSSPDGDQSDPRYKIKTEVSNQLTSWKSSSFAMAQASEASFRGRKRKQKSKEQKELDKNLALIADKLKESQAYINGDKEGGEASSAYLAESETKMDDRNVQPRPTIVSEEPVVKQKLIPAEKVKQSKVQKHKPVSQDPKSNAKVTQQKVQNSIQPKPENEEKQPSKKDPALEKAVAPPPEENTIREAAGKLINSIIPTFGETKLRTPQMDPISTPDITSDSESDIQLTPMIRPIQRFFGFGEAAVEKTRESLEEADDSNTGFSDEDIEIGDLVSEISTSYSIATDDISTDSSSDEEEYTEKEDILGQAFFPEVYSKEYQEFEKFMESEGFKSDPKENIQQENSRAQPEANVSKLKNRRKQQSSGSSSTSKSGSSRYPIFLPEDDSSTSELTDTADELDSIEEASEGSLDDYSDLVGRESELSIESAREEEQVYENDVVFGADHGPVQNKPGQQVYENQQLLLENPC